MEKEKYQEFHKRIESLVPDEYLYAKVNQEVGTLYNKETKYLDYQINIGEVEKGKIGVASILLLSNKKVDSDLIYKLFNLQNA